MFKKLYRQILYRQILTLTLTYPRNSPCKVVSNATSKGRHYQNFALFILQVGGREAGAGAEDRGREVGLQGGAQTSGRTQGRTQEACRGKSLIDCFV